jgi:hypothetical protein
VLEDALSYSSFEPLSGSTFDSILVDALVLVSVPVLESDNLLTCIVGETTALSVSYGSCFKVLQVGVNELVFKVPWNASFQTPYN